MKKIPEEVISFFQEQRFVIVSTIDSKGRPHNSCKGIIDINPSGKVHLLDLYLKETFANLKRDPNISITAVDEHSFRGYSLKGWGTIISRGEMSPELIKKWGEQVNKRISHRIIRNIREEKTQKSHPEALFPKPAYMVMVEVEEIVNLNPQHLKKEV